MDEIGLCWKRIPDGIHNSKKENLMPDYKAAKDRLIANCCWVAMLPVI